MTHPQQMVVRPLIVIAPRVLLIIVSPIRDHDLSLKFDVSRPMLTTERRVLPVLLMSVTPLIVMPSVVAHEALVAGKATGVS